MHFIALLKVLVVWVRFSCSVSSHVVREVPAKVLVHDREEQEELSIHLSLECMRTVHFLQWKKKILIVYHIC